MRILMSDRIYNSILQLHSKLDDQAKEISEIKVAQANLPCSTRETRLKIIERIVYGAVAIILIGFMVSVAGTPTKRASAKPEPIMRAIK